MSFANPAGLLLLALIPVVLYIGWPRHRYRRTRDITGAALRVVIVALLVLALSGLQVAQAANKLAVVFLVDVSDSVGAAAVDGAVRTVRESLAAMGPEDEAGLVVFGADAQVERVVSAARELGPLRATVSTGNTNIAGAIRLGLALFPADAARRIVIISDGQATLGDSLAAAQLAAASGVQISYLPVTRVPAPEVRVTAFHAPATVPQGQQFDLRLTVQSDTDTTARISIFAGGELVTAQETTLRQGENSRTLTLESTDSGFRDFSVVVEPRGDDGFYQNNRLATFSQIVGPARVLIVGGADETRYLRDALTQAGLVVDTAGVEDLPGTPAGLAQYASVVLANVPAVSLPEARMRALQTYVRDLGGGLLVLGGPEAYGPGGYFRTPLEEILPVEMQLRDQQRLPQLTLAYVIDRSGSMATSDVNGVPLIEVAKSAINRSLDLLQPTDRAAIATFDAIAYWIADFQEVRDRRALQELVGTLRPSGGTDVLSGVRLVAENIVNEPARLKHIILLTDGQTNPSGLVDTVGALYRDHNVTTTTISIGGASSLLESMARAGGGNYRVANDITQVPLIFAQETVLVTRSYILETPFVPMLTAISPIMSGIDALPELQGYVGATPKAAAQVILRAPEPFRDPVLAAWQYGLGRAVAFTSDATARWGADWVTWEGFSQFWNQAVRWTITEGSGSTVETQVVMEGETARLIVDARDADGGFLNGLTLAASVVDPALASERVALRQVAPGRYEAAFRPGNEGAYLLRISGESVDAQQVVNQTTGWVMSYSAEYLAADSESVLPRVAEITGGRSLDGLTDAIFARDIEARAASLPLAPWLVLAAMLLLPFDIGVRRLLITRSDWVRLRQWFAARREPQGGTERISTLIDARDRARDKARIDAPGELSTVGALKARREQRRGDASAPVMPPASAEKSATPATVSADAAPKPPASSGENIGARLLKKRRETPDE